jgi:citrate lyase subunit beta/citryl-CoA lyase
MCIYPDQLKKVNECFSPSEKQIAQAKRIIEAFAVAEKQGLAAIQVDGKFVDYPIVYLAEKLVQRANAIEENFHAKN